MEAATSSDHPALTDGTSNERRTVRLVRLRLILTIAAAAILPIAVIAPVLRWIGDDSRAGQEAALHQEAVGVSARLAAALETAGQASRAAARDDAIRTQLLKPSRSGLVAAQATLDRLEELIPSGVLADLLDAHGTEVAKSTGAASSAVISGIATPTPANVGSPAPGGDVSVSAPIRSGDTAVVAVSAAVAGSSGGDAGFVRLIVRIDPLFSPGSDGWSGGRRARLVDTATGSILFAVAGSSDAGAVAGEVLGRAIDPASGLLATGRAALQVPGADSWAVEVSQPFAVATVPPLAIALLFGLCFVIVLLIAWMGRQVLQPAVELEASRHRLSELYAAERESSLRDHLTGLGNHRAFQEALTRQFDQWDRYRTPMALLLVDLDEFKHVNDSLGHAVGDDLLAEVGRLMTTTIRQADRAFRTGGDEFAVVLPQTDADGAVDLGERLLRRMLEDRATGRYRRPISFSAGVAACPADAVDRLQLQARADAALYRSKRKGRTMVTAFDSSVDRPAIEGQARADLSERVAALVRSRALTPVYQPIVDLATGRIIGFEGLVRPAAGSGFGSPAELFSAAEATGRIVDLDRACLEVASAGAVGLPEDVFITLNISPRSFEAPEFSASAFLAILKRAAIDPRRVVIELTEREAIVDLERLRTALATCRSAGVQVAADDVGAGNAGLQLLSQIRFEVMKIDLSLVQAGAGREPVSSILSTLVDLGRRWRALVVAEGVETPEQLAIVKGLGIDAAQGYLLGRPGPAPGPASGRAMTVDIDGIIERATRAAAWPPVMAIEAAAAR